MTFRAIAFLDTMALSVLLYRERSLFDKDGEGSLRNLEVWSRLKLKEWKVAKSVVARALDAIGGGGPRPDLAGVSMQKLLPQGFVPWSRNVAWASLRFHLPIVTNPACQMFSGPYTAHLPVGQLTFVATDILHSEINLGDTPRWHLVIDVKKPEPDLPDAGPGDPGDEPEEEA